MLNEQDFAAAVLPSGFHIVGLPVLLAADIVSGTWVNGSIPVSGDLPWYSEIFDVPHDCDEFTAWLNTAYVRANVNTTSTDEDEANHVLSFLAADVVRYLGVTESTGILLGICNALVVGGAAYIKEFGYVPLDAVEFLDTWEIE